MFYGALHAIALTGSLSGFDGIEIGRFWLQAFDANAKSHIGMVPVHSVGRFCSLVQFRRIRTVVHDSVMLVRAPGLLVVHRMMAELSEALANSSSGPWVIQTCVVVGAGGRISLGL
jgi:hypothetical protein